jgi:hypothetical protein
MFFKNTGSLKRYKNIKIDYNKMGENKYSFSANLKNTKTITYTVNFACNNIRGTA